LDAGQSTDANPTWKAEIRRFFIPIESFEVLDTWNVIATKATGSDDGGNAMTALPCT